MVRFSACFSDFQIMQTLSAQLSMQCVVFFCAGNFIKSDIMTTGFLKDGRVVKSYSHIDCDSNKIKIAYSKESRGENVESKPTQ